MTTASQETLARLRSTYLVAVIRAPTADGALRAVDALVAGGVRGVEITYSTPEVPRVLAAIARRYGTEVVLGAGTLLSPQQASEAVAAGAEFLVSPGLDDDLVSAMRHTGALTMAGALSPTEIMRAQSLRVDVVKIFPASLGGPAYVRSLKGPFPDVPMMPTGGVSLATLDDWISAEVVAVGAGSELCGSDDIAEQRFGLVEERARHFRAKLAM